MHCIRRRPVLGIHPLLVPLLITIAGCGADAPEPSAPPPPQQTLVTRLAADPAANEATVGTPASGLATIDIDHDTRPVAGGVRSFRVLEPVVLEVDDEGRVRVPFEPATAMLAGKRVALEPTWRDDEGWHALKPRPAEVQIDESGAPLVVLELPEQAGQTLELYAKAHGPLPSPVERLQLPAVEVPSDALLELAFGVLRLGEDESVFDYEIEACSDTSAGEPDIDEDAEPCVPLFASVSSGGETRGWTELSVPLDEVAGRRVGFRLTTRRRGEAASSLAVPAWSEASLWQSSGEVLPRRNVVLVSLDTLRADHLPFYGYPVDTAPFLDEAFAQRGTLFERPVAAAASTASSHMSIFTGLDALTHQVANMYRSLSDEYATVAESLRRPATRRAPSPRTAPCCSARASAEALRATSRTRKATSHPSTARPRIRWRWPNAGCAGIATSPSSSSCTPTRCTTPTRLRRATKR